MSRVLFLFIDGVGLGDVDPAVNPFTAAALPALSELLEGNQLILANAGCQNARCSLVALDARLDVPGLPQSGTGQTALFTGRNAAQIFGRHFGPWVPTALRPLLGAENLLSRARDGGRTIAFANAYPEEVFAEGRKARDPLRAGPPLAALGAGVLNRHTPELMRGDAIASEIINEGWRTHLQRTELPRITPLEAGHNLARLAAQHDLTLFAHYSTDHVGHTGHMEESIVALQRVDQFLAGILEQIPDDLTIVLASDHGNLEDVRVGHTLNPAIGLFIGGQHARLAAGTHSLMDVTPKVLQLADTE